MLSTTIFLALLVGVLVVYVLLWAFLLQLGARWVDVENATTRRVLVTAGLIALLQTVINTGAALLPETQGAASILIGFALLAVSVFAAVFVIAKRFSIRLSRAFKAWLPTLLAPVAVVSFVFFVLRPLLYETYITTTMAMAPTLVGDHWRVPCPECGQDAFTSPEMGYMICEDYDIARPDFIDQGLALHTPDRFLVAKFFKPRRWDLLVFQAPEDPSMIFVKRVVGMPGETLTFENGFFLANGQKLTPPDAIGGLQYGLHFTENWEFDMWGSAEKPAALADDEYFVVGDFSTVSRDSRDWREGADGHNPYAVPRSHVIGVVTHRYSPLSRFEIIR